MGMISGQFDAFLKQKKRANVMQLFLQPITEHYCDGIISKCAPWREFAFAFRIGSAGKGCELRGLLFSFAA
jgi:hypothetical protein